jgi:hypothetical protein
MRHRSAEQGVNDLSGRDTDWVQVLSQEQAEPVAISRSASWSQAMGPFHGDRELFEQRLEEGGTRSVESRAIGLKVGGDNRDRDTEGGSEPNLHAHSVIQARPVQDSNHPGDLAQSQAIQLEKAASFAVADQVLFVGVAKRQEDSVRPSPACELTGDVGAQGPVVGREQSVCHVVQSHYSSYWAAITKPGPFTASVAALTAASSAA